MTNRIAHPELVEGRTPELAVGRAHYEGLFCGAWILDDDIDDDLDDDEDDGFDTDEDNDNDEDEEDDEDDVETWQVDPAREDFR